MKTTLAVLSALFVAAASPALAQSQPVQTASVPAQGFESENAILDTSIPFAAGAREARQELRGAFGWSTFQEGQVNGIYFRFDPDGYARFATTPRLDTDVFEVICRPRTLSCMGRKGELSVALTGAGQVQIGLQTRVAGDRYFLSEGVSEVEVPDRILQPLDSRLEALMGTGGALVVRRGEQVAARISLNGFEAVAAYLRWIAARQDYAVLPRNWPVPGARRLVAQPLQTEVQALSPVTSVPSAAGVAEAQLFDPLATPQAAPQPALPSREVAEVRGELNMLRKMLLDQQANQAPVDTGGSRWAQGPVVPAASSGDTRLLELERSNQMLMHELQRLRAMQGGGGLQDQGMMQPRSPAQAPPLDASAGDRWPRLDGGTGRAPGLLGQDQALLPSASAPRAAPNTMEGSAHADPATVARQTADRLEYLMTEIGLDARTALLLIQSSGEADIGSPASEDGSYQDALVSDILAELQEQMPVVDTPMSQAEPDMAALQGAIPADEFMLLSDYFRSVMPRP
ncbi:hypothetical protein [Pseudaestuariivita atlantica]|uniref:Uncharacterized protein n=1 Tax=Pseudaestuariivita atlantica TaxID=1317121 RepID=A0A0L1JPT7_9RHOB|nr:hypothetical protein [Pseudaestuariivita atlantica]KNG93413.1 hypothetical protein ATO11_13385 [Pseudaestuariivita atlantica]